MFNPVAPYQYLLTNLYLSVADIGGEWVGGLDQGREGWGGVMSV